jgi:hypothetical protein
MQMGALLADTLTVINFNQAAFAASDTLICQKFCMDFFDQSTNNPTSWQWQFPGAFPASSNSQNPTDICYDNPGIFDVTLIALGPTGSDTLTLIDFITVYPTPAFPSITQSGNTLTSSPASGYQWQFNSIDIGGATNQSYIANQTGYYTIVITDANGCVSSTTVYVEVTGIEDPLNADEVLIYPNPSNGFFTLEINCAACGNSLSLKIYNTLGELVYLDEELVMSEHHLVKQIDLHALPTAVFFMEIEESNNSSSGIGSIKKILAIH